MSCVKVISWWERNEQHCVCLIPDMTFETGASECEGGAPICAKGRWKLGRKGFHNNRQYADVAKGIATAYVVVFVDSDQINGFWITAV